jgi:1-acyl-sn-glycerol-3-phosphate acyltransferase
MTRAVPFTQARIERAIKAAKKQGMRVILRPDGTIVLEKINPQDDPDRQNEKSEVVL